MNSEASMAHIRSPATQSGVAGHSSQIWFTMSTWNPYQSMLMTAEITANLL